MTQQDTMHGLADVLSPAAWAALKLNSEQAYTMLVVQAPPYTPARSGLQSLADHQILARPVKNPDYAQCLLSGLWLWHDFLDESHRIAQQVQTPSGSFWHAIMHRREGDFDNSKYWYARCTDHPIFKVIAAHAAPIINPLPADNLLLRLVAGGWDPVIFVDLMQKAHANPTDPRHAIAVVLQQLEWRMLFDHCAREA